MNAFEQTPPFFTTDEDAYTNNSLRHVTESASVQEKFLPGAESATFRLPRPRISILGDFFGALCFPAFSFRFTSGSLASGSLAGGTFRPSPLFPIHPHMHQFFASLFSSFSSPQSLSPLHMSGSLISNTFSGHLYFTLSIIPFFALVLVSLGSLARGIFRPSPLCSPSITIHPHIPYISSTVCLSALTPQSTLVSLSAFTCRTLLSSFRRVVVHSRFPWNCFNSAVNAKRRADTACCCKLRTFSSDVTR